MKARAISTTFLPPSSCNPPPSPLLGDRQRVVRLCEDDICVAYHIWKVVIYQDHEGCKEKRREEVWGIHCNSQANLLQASGNSVRADFLWYFFSSGWSAVWKWESNKTYANIPVIQREVWFNSGNERGMYMGSYFIQFGLPFFTNWVSIDICLFAQ